MPANAPPNTTNAGSILSTPLKHPKMQSHTSTPKRYQQRFSFRAATKPKTMTKSDAVMAMSGYNFVLNLKNVTF